MKKKLKFIIDDKEIEVNTRKSESLLDLAIRMKLPLQHSCGGMGTCGTCRVIIREGIDRLPIPDEVELNLINDRGLAKEERLACQIEAQEGIVVEIPASVM